MATQLDLLGADSGAEFSPCGRYRYRLWRTWDLRLKPLAFIMLNPSTADEAHNDPTVERCQRRAAAAGWGGLLVGNLFALRSTDPQRLYQVEDPVGQRNDQAIERIAQEAGQVICAWGNHGMHRGRGEEVLARLQQLRITPYYLRLTGQGCPSHPLYVPYDEPPKPCKLAL